jgi:hypothetical protein
MLHASECSHACSSPSLSRVALLNAQTCRRSSYSLHNGGSTAGAAGILPRRSLYKRGCAFQCARHSDQHSEYYIVWRMGFYRFWKSLVTIVGPGTPGQGRREQRGKEKPVHHGLSPVVSGALLAVTSPESPCDQPVASSEQACSSAKCRANVGPLGAALTCTA